MPIASEQLQTLTVSRLRGMRRGIEKESLRTDSRGRLAVTPHPPVFGSALTHPKITTDFSESQLELITGIHADVTSCMDELRHIHQLVFRSLGEERLWVASMPCGLPDDDAIPLGQYGNSNIGRAKTVYRRGLGFRYGRRMQTISGIHYNWSLPGTSSDEYFGLIRNFRRHAFLLLYLFGASPAVCSSFVAGRAHALQALNAHCMMLPYATSLRMGRLGYQSDAQSSLSVSYNSLEGYGDALERAMTAPYPPYAAMGLRDDDGAYRQLSTTLLQIENEFYGTIRPKRVIHPGERPLHALRQRGVEYVEVRLMDLDPFEPVGIQDRTLRFLDLFLLHCLLSHSPQDSSTEIAAMARNQQTVAERGREPGLTLERNGETIGLSQWATDLLVEMAPLAKQLDSLEGENFHALALEHAHACVAAPSLLPSARVLHAVQEEYSGSYTRFVNSRSEAIQSTILDLPWNRASQETFDALARDSQTQQTQIEAADRFGFDEYLQEYLAPRRLQLP